MSNKAIDWALEQDIQGPAKTILLVLANRANDKGICWPSHSRIMKESGFSGTTVRNGLTKLREKGLIKWTQRRDAHSNSLSSNSYQLRIPPTTGDAIPLPHMRTHPTTAADIAPHSSRSTPPAGDGEKPKVEPSSNQKKKREPWMIQKDIERVEETIAKIKENTDNHEQWITNNNQNGGFPLLKEEAKKKLELLKQKKSELEKEFEKTLLNVSGRSTEL